MSSSEVNKEPVYLEADDEIRGQSFVCLSFLTPNRGLLKDKNLFFFSKFMEFYNMDYKIRATEGFVMSQLNMVQNTLSDIDLRIRNASVPTSSDDYDAFMKSLTDDIGALRSKLSSQTTVDMETFVKSNIMDFKESSIIESYEKFMLVNRQKLEDEFHKQKNFQTTMHGLKVRGVYSNNEQAKARAKALNKKDPHFNVFVGDVGQWLPWDPSPDDVADQEYNNDTDEGKRLNDLMRAYKENSERRNAFFEEEKQAQTVAAANAVKASKEKATLGTNTNTNTNANDMPSTLFGGPETLDTESMTAVLFESSGEILRPRNENTISHV